MTVAIGGTAIRITTGDAGLSEELRTQYEAFIKPDTAGSIHLTVHSIPPSGSDPNADVRVSCDAGRWMMDRGDFHACYDPAARTAVVHAVAGRYGVDSAIRITHSLVLAEQRGFLLHASSLIRGGRAFIFAGPSGAGKTTISRLAREEDHLLTDEISCIRRCQDSWIAFGTPFAGELARSGENRQAPVEALYLLRHGRENYIEPLSTAAAVRSILRNVLFFAADPRLTDSLFDTICKFACDVQVCRLSFVPDARVWDLIQ